MSGPWKVYETGARHAWPFFLHNDETLEIARNAKGRHRRWKTREAAQTKASIMNCAADDGSKA